MKPKIILNQVPQMGKSNETITINNVTNHKCLYSEVNLDRFHTKEPIRILQPQQIFKHLPLEYVITSIRINYKIGIMFSD